MSHLCIGSIYLVSPYWLMVGLHTHTPNHIWYPLTISTYTPHINPPIHKHSSHLTTTIDTTSHPPLHTYISTSINILNSHIPTCINTCKSTHHYNYIYPCPPTQYIHARKWRLNLNKNTNTHMQLKATHLQSDIALPTILPPLQILYLVLQLL